MTQCQLLCLYRGSAHVFGEMSGCLSGQNKDMERWKEPIVNELYSTSQGSVSSTISCWLKDTLVLLEVTEILDFGGHSTRSASTSKVELSGLSVKEVLDEGPWSNESTWQKFYKEILKVGQDYQKNVF